MGGDKSIEVPPALALLSNTGTIVALALLVCSFWLWRECKKRQSGEHFIHVVMETKSDFFQLFGRVSVFLICVVVSISYMAYSEEMMDAVFEKIPTYYVLYIFIFMAFETFWKIVAQFTKFEGH